VPELPEVETVVRTLRPRLLGSVISTVWTSGKRLRLARPIDRAALARLSIGARVVAVRRRAKYVIIELDRGGAGILVHLGMTGRLRLQASHEPQAKHTHVVWSLAGGGELRFVDPRRFGWVAVSRAVDELPELAGLGPDALTELELPGLRDRLASSKAPLKSFLLDQRRIAGLGNIYVCEALFRARLHPRTPARRAVDRAAALLRAIRAVLRVALANRGTSMRDFVDAAGESGTNASALLVYGREGEPCRACRAPVRRLVDSGRSTFYCPHCQRETAVGAA
jgi:formamidopyrimidine-DNA glycosylase